MTTTNLAASANGAGQPRSAQVPLVWLALALFAGLFILAHLASGLYEMTLGADDRGTLGATYDVFHEPADGYYPVTAVLPDGAVARLGVRPGDALRFDRGYDFYRALRKGETVGLTVRHPNGLSHHVATAGPVAAMPWSTLAFALLFTLTRCVIVLIGMVIMVRGDNRVLSLLLGLGLVSLGEYGAIPTMPESTPAIYPAFIVIAMLIFELGPIPFFGFALAARQANSHRGSARWVAAFRVYAAAKFAEAVYIIAITLVGRSMALIGDTFDFDVALTDFGFVLALVVLIAACRESRGDERTRFAFLLVASGLLITALEAVPFTLDPVGNNTPLGFAMLAGALIGAAVFAYAILRHRVIDLGFVVNRTMVFGLVSVVLLCAFGVIEWAVDHLVPIRGREENSLIDAAIALGVYLTFHRVHDFVEQWVERLLFRHWHHAEAQLRRFVKEAAYVRNPDALCAASIAALSRYADGAQTALYLAGTDGAFALAAGGVSGIAGALGLDDPLVVALRADPRPIEPTEREAMPGAALVAPLVIRKDLAGVFVFGRKPSDQSYRPDEIALISWASMQIGLDLHALKIERLEAAADELRRTIATLEAQKAELRLALAAGLSA